MKIYIMLAIGVFVVIAIALLALGWINYSTRQINNALEELKIPLEAENWPQVEAQTAALIKAWQQVEPSWHILIDHGEIHRVEEPFYQMLYSLKHRLKADAGHSLEAMVYWLEYIREIERVSWQNIF